MVANFQSSDGNFLQYRAFLYLHSRLLSSLQFEIEQFEKELKDLDDWDMTCKDTKREKCLRCRERDDSQSKFNRMPAEFKARFDRTRPDVIAILRVKLMEYGMSSA